MEISCKDKKFLNFIDAHVHIYDCFDLEIFFKNAFRNIRKAASAEMADNVVKQGVLYLAETKGSNWFSLFEEKAASEVVSNGLLSAFKFAKTLETHSIKVCYPNHPAIFIIASQQIITAEKIEVLALGTKDKLPDGLPIQEVLERVQILDALIVLPWGVGKWLGNRGKIIKSIISSQRNRRSSMFLGDIAGRPWLWPLAPMVDLARSYGYQILSGTDPLPLATEAVRAGAYGSILKGEISSEYPAESLKRLLQTSTVNFQQYGRNEKIYRFIQNQILIRL